MVFYRYLKKLHTSQRDPTKAELHDTVPLHQHILLYDTLPEQYSNWLHVTALEPTITALYYGEVRHTSTRPEHRSMHIMPPHQYGILLKPNGQDRTEP